MVTLPAESELVTVMATRPLLRACTRALSDPLSRMCCWLVPSRLALSGFGPTGVIACESTANWAAASIATAPAAR